MYAAALTVVLLAAVPAAADHPADLAAKLNDRISLDKVEDTPLAEVLARLGDRLGATVLVDRKAFGDADVAAAPVSLPAVKKLRISTALKLSLDRVDAAYLVKDDHILVTSHAKARAAAGPARVLRDAAQDDPAGEAGNDQGDGEVALVHATFKDAKLADALKELAKQAGKTVVLSKAVGDKWQEAVSLELANATFEAAVAAVAEAVELKAVRLGGVAVVTTRDRAAELLQRAAPGQPAVAAAIAAVEELTKKVEELTKVKDHLDEELAKVKIESALADVRSREAVRSAEEAKAKK